MSTSSIQTAIAAAVAQIAAVAVAFGVFNTAEEQIIVTATGTVLAAVFAVINAVEQWKTVQLAQLSK